LTDPASPDHRELDQQISSRFLELFIRAGLLGLLVVLCYRIFLPFLSLMVWAVVLAVALYPLHQWLARKLRNKQGLASTILVVASVLIILLPTALLLNSVGDSVRRTVDAVEKNTLKIPPPSEAVKKWRLGGRRIYDIWSKAHSDLPGFVHDLEPKFSELERKALSGVASIGMGLLVFLASLIVAGIIMAYGASAARGSRALFDRVFGAPRGVTMAHVAAATVRAVAKGILGVALIQAVVTGLVLLLTGVPGAGLLAMIILIFSIANVPTLLLALPVAGYYWMSGHFGFWTAMVYSALVVLSGLLDNLLKPILLGRGVDAPMPVVLLGALGGMVSHGLVGLFVGTTLLTLGYNLLLAWVAPAPTSNLQAAPT
jgi:predicted PurR-regulated permease PerM